MGSRKKSRIYWRKQGKDGELRAYGDFRDVGGGREALIPEGETRATTDQVIAESLVAKRLADLHEHKRTRELLGIRRRVGLKTYAAEHLVNKAKSGKVTDRHLEALEQQLGVAVEFFGEDRDLASIAVEHIQEYANALRDRDNGRGGTLSSSSQARYLSALSNLFRRAQGEGIIRGVNPVEALLDKPTPGESDEAWLEVWEGALLLEAARTYPYGSPPDATAGDRLRMAIARTLGTGSDGEAEFVARMRAEGKLATTESLRAYCAGERIPTKDYLLCAARVLGLPESALWRRRGWLSSPNARPSRIAYPIIATFLLTGGRRAEILGLEMRDVDFERGIIRIRPNQWRRIKNRKSHRSVPLWPQLREILEPYVKERREAGAEDTDLLFPSPATGKMYTNFEKSVDAIAARAGWNPGEIRMKACRHTYCSARLQTLDRGYPVSEFTVGKEMGHGGHNLVRKVYGHLGQIRHRSEFVEYRVEQHHEVIPPERLRLLVRIA